MANLIVRHAWQISENAATPKAIFRQRRQLLKAAGLVGLGLVGMISPGCGPANDAATIGA